MMKSLLVVMMCLIGSLDIFAAGALPFLPQFSPAKPGYAYIFPRDHGSHAQFQTEWWYLQGMSWDRMGDDSGMN